MIMIPKIKPMISPKATLFGVLLLVIDEASSPCKLMVGSLMSMSRLHAICPIAANITATVPKITCHTTAPSVKKDTNMVTNNAPQVKIALKASFAKICA